MIELSALMVGMLSGRFAPGREAARASGALGTGASQTKLDFEDTMRAAIGRLGVDDAPLGMPREGALPQGGGGEAKQGADTGHVASTRSWGDALLARESGERAAVEGGPEDAGLEPEPAERSAADQAAEAEQAERDAMEAVTALLLPDAPRSPEVGARSLALGCFTAAPPPERSSSALGALEGRGEASPSGQGSWLSETRSTSAPRPPAAAVGDALADRGARPAAGAGPRPEEPSAPREAPSAAPNEAPDRPAGETASAASRPGADAAPASDRRAPEPRGEPRDPSREPDLGARRSDAPTGAGKSATETAVGAAVAADVAPREQSPRARGARRGSGASQQAEALEAVRRGGDGAPSMTEPQASSSTTGATASGESVRQPQATTAKAAPPAVATDETIRLLQPILDRAAVRRGVSAEVVDPVLGRVGVQVESLQAGLDITLHAADPATVTLLTQTQAELGAHLRAGAFQVAAIAVTPTPRADVTPSSSPEGSGSRRQGEPREEAAPEDRRRARTSGRRLRAVA